MFMSFIRFIFSDAWIAVAFVIILAVIFDGIVNIIKTLKDKK